MWALFPYTWSSGDAPPPPPPEVVVGSLLHIDLPKTILSSITTEETDSSAFAMPSKASRLTWQVLHNPATVNALVQLKASLDNVNYDVIDSQTTDSTKTVVGGFPFIRARVEDNPDESAITVIVEPKRDKL